MRRTETIDTALERGSNAASGAENGTRAAIRAILNSPRKMAGFSPDEAAAMKRVVNGSKGGNLLKKLGKFGPGIAQQTNHLGATLGAGGGAAAGGLLGGPMGSAFGAIAVPALGAAAQRASEAATRKHSAILRALVATGGQAPAGRQVSELERRIIEGLTTRAAKGATLPLVR